jgi:hypothetical protein
VLRRLVLAAVVVSSCARGLDQKERDENEVAVYTALLRDHLALRGQAVLSSETAATGDGMRDVPRITRRLKERVTSQATDFPESGLDDLARRTRAPTPLETGAPIPGGWTLLSPDVSPEEARKAFADHPTSTAIIKFSRVGFSSDGRWSAAYVDEGNWGGLLLLHKVDGQWKETQEVGMWVTDVHQK